MSVTYTTPVRIFKRNNPTNDGTPAAPSNTGAAVCSNETAFSVTAAGAILTTPIGASGPTVQTLPAGAIVQNVKLYETTAPTTMSTGVITVSIGGTAVGTITATATNGGVISIAWTATAAVAALLANIGTSDLAVTYSLGGTLTVGTLAGYFSLDYTPRNFDGSITNVGQGYTN